MNIKKLKVGDLVSVECVDRPWMREFGNVKEITNDKLVIQCGAIYKTISVGQVDGLVKRLNGGVR